MPRNKILSQKVMVTKGHKSLRVDCEKYEIEKALAWASRNGGPAEPSHLCDLWCVKLILVHLGKPSFKKSAVFLNIVQKAFDPPPPFI